MATAIDINKIDAQIRRLQELKRIASDPEMLMLLEGLVTKNGNVAPDSPNRMTRKPIGGKDALLQATRQAISALPYKRFSASYLVEQMHKDGFQFTASNPTVAMNGVLRRLDLKKEIVMVRPASGRTAKEYERVINITGTESTEPERHGRGSDPSRPAMVLALYRNRPDEIIDVETVARELNLDTSAVRAPLMRLADDGKLTRVDRGKYKLAPANPVGPADTVTG